MQAIIFLAHPVCKKKKKITATLLPAAMVEAIELEVTSLPLGEHLTYFKYSLLT